MGIYGSHFPNLSNEQKFVLADVAACKAEEIAGQKMTKDQYEQFVFHFIMGLYEQRLDNEGSD